MSLVVFKRNPSSTEALSDGSREPGTPFPRNVEGGPVAVAQVLNVQDWSASAAPCAERMPFTSAVRVFPAGSASVGVNVNVFASDEVLTVPATGVAPSFNVKVVPDASGWLNDALTVVDVLTSAAPDAGVREVRVMAVAALGVNETSTR